MKMRSPAFAPLMFAEMAFASWEVVARRTVMMATGTCSPAEYQCMLAEKTAAAMQTGLEIAAGRATMTSMMKPWHAKSRANAKRLRRM